MITPLTPLRWAWGRFTAYMNRIDAEDQAYRTRHDPPALHPRVLEAIGETRREEERARGRQRRQAPPAD